ncbi:DsbA family protein [Streptomyces chartreusis]|uniref:DsbA family oxidoreductase n=1 Tax=Streptomyces chartreusis TaxID=1969 RepID=UPI00368F3955
MTTARASDPKASASAVNVQVWSDFVCPFCMLAEGPLEEASVGLDVEIEWMPFELRPYPTPTLRPEDPYLPEIWERSVYPMARRTGVDITLPTVSPQPYTRLAFEGYQYAAAHGRGREYTPRVLRAFFQQNRDIGQIDVLADIAREIGLDGEDVAAALEKGTYAAAHQAALRESVVHRIEVVPTLIIDGHTRIEGVATASRIRKALRNAQDRTASTQWLTCGVNGC